ncbi:hypothetical protein M9458_053659 [Cirrhinus mrigala]|uniref:L1 transposable element RRM domain-containing protein n=1 Tax=Cirrhinus mrigala TaxID=683832 RepID=A0ABD0MRD3_CIRMR
MLLGNAALVGELQQLRKENQQGHIGTKESLTRLETSVEELKDQITKLETRIVEAEERISNNEDSVMRHGRAIRYLLQREVQLSASEEGKNPVEFVKYLHTSTLNSLPDVDIKIERAHRALASKPKDTEPPRSIVVKFTDFPVKEAILRQAWLQKQRRRAQVRDVIRQLKKKGITAWSFYPAQLKISLDSGDKSFSPLADALPILQELGIALETELSRPPPD